MNEKERYESIMIASQLLQQCKVGAMWVTFRPNGEQEVHIFRYDSIEKARIVGQEFSKLYQELHDKHFPEGEVMDSDTGKVRRDG